MKKFDYANNPNPTKFLNSYRHLGYNNYSAIADIVDNSFDAGADSIWITVNTINGGNFKITISDNGDGMDKKVLEQAYRLGALTERDIERDLGKFGVGSASASLSISRKTTVITKKDKNPCLVKIIDLDYMIANNTFNVYLGEAEKAETKLFNEMCHKSDTGTTVLLDDCDNIQNKSVTQFKNQLRKHIGQVFRMFIDAGKEIYLNDESLSAIDPLLISGFNFGDIKYETTIFSDENYSLNIKEDGKEKSEKVRIKIALLPLVGKGMVKQRWPKDVDKPSQQAQGFYVMRNNREIASADSLSLFVKHNSLNRFRAEIFFPAKMDKYFGVNFTKRKVDLNQSIFDQLNKYLKDQIETLKKILHREKGEKEEDVQLSFRETEQAIEQKSILLIKKKQTAEEIKKQHKKQKTKASEEIEKEKKRIIDSSGKMGESHFETTSLGKNGVFFETDKIGHTQIIKYNVDHPFYDRFYAEKDKDTQNAINFLMYSFVIARNGFDENTSALMEMMEGIWSLNLKALLD